MNSFSTKKNQKDPLRIEGQVMFSMKSKNNEIPGEILTFWLCYSVTLYVGSFFGQKKVSEATITGS